MAVSSRVFKKMLLDITSGMRKASLDQEVEAVLLYRKEFQQFSGRELKAAFKVLRQQEAEKKFARITAPALTVAVLAIQKSFGVELNRNEIRAALGLIRGSAVELPHTSFGLYIEAAAVAVLSLSYSRVQILTQHGYQAQNCQNYLEKFYRSLQVIGVSYQPLEEAVASTMRRFLDGLTSRPVEKTFTLVHDFDVVLCEHSRTTISLTSDNSEYWEVLFAINRAVAGLVEHEDYEPNFIHKTVVLLPQGNAKLKNALGAAATSNQILAFASQLLASLKAYALYEKDRDYAVTGNGIAVIDEFSGRILPHKKFELLLQQALEMKEHVTTEARPQDFAAQTMHGFLKQQALVAGLGSLFTPNITEIKHAYGLPVLVNRQLEASHDIYFKTAAGRITWLMQRAAALVRERVPLLVCVANQQEAETVSAKLSDRRLKTAVLVNSGGQPLGNILTAAARQGKIIIATAHALADLDMLLESCQMPEKPVHAVALGRNLTRRFDEQLAHLLGVNAEICFTHALDSEWFLEPAVHRLRLAFDRAGILQHQGQELSKLDELVMRAQMRLEEQSTALRLRWFPLDELWESAQHELFGQIRQLIGSPLLVSQVARASLTSVVDYIFRLEQGELIGRELAEVLRLPFDSNEVKHLALNQTEKNWELIKKNFLRYGFQRLNLLGRNVALQRGLAAAAVQLWLENWSGVLEHIEHIYRDAETTTEFDSSAFTAAAAAARAAIRHANFDAQRQFIQTVFFYLEQNGMLD